MTPAKTKPHAGGRGVLTDASALATDTESKNTFVPLSPPALAVVQSQPAGELIGERPALIPPGEYQLRLTHWETAVMWGRSQKLCLTFSVCTFGEHFGVKLVRYYNVAKIVGKPGRFGHFKVTWGQDLVRDYCQLFSTLQRLDRINLERLARVIVLGRVETVKTTAAQRGIAPSLRYSVVRELVRIEAGEV